jgi:hypothetical protein
MRVLWNLNTKVGRFVLGLVAAVGELTYLIYVAAGAEPIIH